MKALPLGWAIPPLGELVSPTRPKVNPADHATLQFIGLEHIEAHTMKLLGTAPAKTVRSSCIHFWPGDLLYGRLRPYLNKVHVSDFEGLCSSEFLVFPASDDLSNGYLQFALNSTAFLEFATRLNTGIDRPRVDFGQIASYRVPLPPVNEQHRIVSEIEKQFTRLDAAEHSLTQTARRLRRYRATVLQTAIDGRLLATDRAQTANAEPAQLLVERLLGNRAAYWGDSRLGRAQGLRTQPVGALPAGWIWASLDALVLRIADVDHRMPRGVPEGLPYVSTKDFTPRGIDLRRAKRISHADYASLSRKIHPEAGDILLSRYGTVGQARLVDSKEPIQASYSLAILKTHRLSTLSRYLQLALSAPSLQEAMKAAVRASSQPDLGLEYIKQLPIPLPPLALQELIIDEVGRRLSDVDDTEDSVQANLRRSNRLRQSILKSALEGKLVPQDAADEPASALVARIRSNRASQGPRTRVVRPKRPGSMPDVDFTEERTA